MHDFGRDPIHGAIYGKHGLKRAIELEFEHECLGAGLILIFSLVDAMANLARPPGQDENTPQDFRDWVGRYIDLSGQTTLTPDDWWAARNAIVHTYGHYSRGVRQGKAKLIMWMTHSIPHIRYSPKVNPDAVLVDIFALKEAVFTGVDKFLADSFSKPENVPLLEDRLQHLIVVIPLSGASAAELSL